MATADNEQILFSKQYCARLTKRVVKIESVVREFIASKTLSKAETTSLLYDKVADRKFRHLLNIITEHCNRKDLKAFETFIAILEETGNIDVAQQLSLIYNERVGHVETLSRLSEEKSLVRKLKNEISRLEGILEGKQKHIKGLIDENKKLEEDYRKLANDPEFRKDKLSLEIQIKKRDEGLLLVEKEMGELTRKKNNLENEVSLRSNVICTRDKEIEEKEKEVCKAIKESNRLRLTLDTLQPDHSEIMVEGKDKSNKIEILEDELAEKEHAITELRKYKTISRKAVEEELGKIMRDQDKKMDAMNEKIDILTDTLMRVLTDKT